MKVLLKFQLLSQSAADLEQKNVRVQVDSPSTLKEVAVLGMQKAGFDPAKFDISSATSGNHPTTVCLDEAPIDLGVYSVMLRERMEGSTRSGALWSGLGAEQSRQATGRAVRQRRKVYILLLGSSGVDKSTFINGVANYTAFKTVIDACNAGGLVYAVPTQINAWNHQDEDDEREDEPNDDFRSVTVGPSGDPTEKFGVGSNTQDVRFYSFLTDEYEIIMIDTPGVGDPDGVHKDQINAQKIVNAIDSVPTLNLILLLFKTTKNRFSESYRYCITELLMRLHNSAMANIAFCFTHTRGFFFQPDEAIKPLSAYLKDLKERHGKTILRANVNSFSVDNEAVQFVLAYHNNVDFERRNIKDFAKSWDRSVAEMHRMINYAAGLQPHEVKKTFSMNKAREAVHVFPKALADINELIETNKRLVAKHKRDIEHLQPVIEDLKQRVEVTLVVYDSQVLDHPRTVCVQCASIERVLDTGDMQVVYKQICHERCYCHNGVVLNGFPEPNTSTKCTAMDSSGKKCKSCGCGWDEHIHIGYIQVATKQTFNDSRTEEELVKETDALRLKQQLLEELEQLLAEYLQEQQIMLKASILFAVYLKENAILPFNDVFEAYVQVCIANEEMCIRANGHADTTKLDNLKRSLAEYSQERDTFLKAVDSGDDWIEHVSVDDITACQQQLFELKHSGAKLKKLYEARLTGYEGYYGAKLELRGPTIWRTECMNE